MSAHGPCLSPAPALKLVWFVPLLLACATAMSISCKGAPNPDVPMTITFPESGDNVVSRSVLDRETSVPKAGVQHILLAWEDLAEIYGTGMDDRAKARTFSQAREQIRAILGELKASENWEKLLKQHSEDPVAAKGKVYDVHPKAKLTRPFRQLSLRLKINEVGVVGSKFGLHIVRRLE